MWHCTQVFVPPESCGPQVCVGAGMCIAPADLLISERTIEQVTDLTAAIIFCLIVFTWVTPKWNVSPGISV